MSTSLPDPDAMRDDLFRVHYGLHIFTSGQVLLKPFTILASFSLIEERDNIWSLSKGFQRSLWLFIVNSKLQNMSIYRTTLIVMALFVSVALCMIPASADTTAQDIVINSDDTVLGRITSIMPDPNAGEMSVTITSITRGMIAPQPAKVGDTLLKDDLIIIVPGAFAKVKFADRAESTLGGGTEGNGFVIRRGTATGVTEKPDVAETVVTQTKLQQRTYTIPLESGQLKMVTIIATGGNEDYILRGGENIPVKRGMEIKVGDQIFIIGEYSIELSEDKNLAPSTIWTVAGSKIIETQEKGVEKGSFEQFIDSIGNFFSRIGSGLEQNEIFTWFSKAREGEF
ncbi:MAG: hypothetical protein Q7V05_09295 [Methanoregula sp.]|nr:hypothetical protein [Methanoregula sp.]